MSASSDALLDQLRSILGAAGLIVEGDDLRYYGTDRCRGAWPVDPLAIAFPKNVDQVQSIVRECATNGIRIVPSGGRTGLAGAATATAGELVLSLERMRKVLEVDATAGWIRCEAGATVEAVRDAASAVGRLYPIDFAAKGSAQIGGSIATNAGGVNVLRHGMTRDWVMGVEVVLASGERIEIGGALVKDNTGYDLRQLFVGSEGTLGIIVAATLRLTVPPRGRVVCLCSAPSDEAVLGLLASLRSTRLPLSAFECFDSGCVKRVLEHRGSVGAGPFPGDPPQHVLIEVEQLGEGDAEEEQLVEALADAQEAGLITDAVVAANASQQAALWAWREDISESLHPHRPHKSDVALPISTLPAFVERWRALVSEVLPEVEALVFGHVGDGNLHLNHLPSASWSTEDYALRCKDLDAKLYALVEEFQGSVSAEHGIGLLKRDHLHHSRSETELSIMRGIRAVLDPTGMFNPGKIF